MADHSSRSPGAESREREDLLRDARQRLAMLEMETHRLRAELARLEAAGEEEAAAAIARQLESEEAKLAAEPRFDLPVDAEKTTRTSARRKKPRSKSAAPTTSIPEPAAAPVIDRATLERTDERTKRKAGWLGGAPAWVVSLLTHVALILALMLVTFAIQQDQRNFLLANAADGEDPFDDFAEISLEAPELEPEELSEQLDSADLPDTLMEDLEVSLDTAALGLEVDSPAAFDALPTDMAGLMAGEAGGAADGTIGSGKKPGGGAKGGTQFFGARSSGNRFVFVVDNSGSMSDGRMETTILELLNSVRAMKPDQEFHVLFHSDQVYPMFFPDSVESLMPATRENRQRLEAWLTTVQMARGGGLKDALDFAASLKPDVVYVLNDGGFLFLPRNGQRTMSSTLRYLTQDTGDWPFTIHTLGMTVRDRDAAEALALIAQAHGGAFTPVGVSPVAAQLARQNRIPYNREPGPVWGSKVRQ